MLALITGPLGKYLGIGALAVSLMGAAGVALHEHDQRVIAGVAAKAAAVQLATERADHVREVAALQDKAAADLAQATRSASIKETIAHAKPSSACAQSAPVRAALDGLRGVSGH